MHQREITFRNNPLVLFGGALDAIRRIARLALGNRNEVADFIGTRRTRPKHPRLKLDELTDIEFVIHEPNLPCRSNWQRRRRRPCGRAGNGRSALSGWPSATSRPWTLRYRTARAAASSGSCSTA